MPRQLCALVLAVPVALTGCATSGAVAPKVDLAPARDAVESARQAGAAERAPESFTKAQGHLGEAESLLTPGSQQSVDKSHQAETLARLAVAEAECAAVLSRQTEAVAAAQRSAPTPADIDKAAARLRKAEEDQRRLEDKIVVLQRDLEMTENEVIRTKARLKGNETKAEASSAIAEARILMRRVADDKGKAATLARCQEHVARAEQLLKEENFGAAAFFAMKAQDVALKSQEGAAADREGPPPQKHYSVKAAVANIRKGPSTSEPVLAAAPHGARLEASALRGDWLKVTFENVTGWVNRSLVE